MFFFSSLLRSFHYYFKNFDDIMISMPKPKIKVQPPASPAISSFTNATTTASSSTVGTIVIFALMTILSVTIVFIILEVYRLRVQTKCLSEERDVGLLDQIIAELPSQVTEQVDASEKRLLNRIEKNYVAIETFDHAVREAAERSAPEARIESDLTTDDAIKEEACDVYDDEAIDDGATMEAGDVNNSDTSKRGVITKPDDELHNDGIEEDVDEDDDDDVRSEDDVDEVM